MFTRWFPKGSGRHLVATNTISQLIGRLISTAAMTAMSVLIARRFGSDGYGDFVKITTYIGFFYLFADFGLNALYVQGSVEQSTSLYKPSWQQLFGLRLVMSLVLIGAALGILSLLPHSSLQGYTPLVRWGIILLSPAIIFQATITTTNGLFQKMLRYDLSAAAQNAGSIIMLVISLVLIMIAPLSGAMVGVMSLFAGSLVTALVALYFVRFLHEAINPKFQPNTMIADVRASLPLGLTLLFNLIYFHSDSVVLTLTRSTQEVGIYGLAYKVFELPLVLPIFFINAVYPILVRMSQKDARSSEQIFWKSLWILLLAAVIIASGLWMLAPLLRFIRPDFAASILPLKILLLGLPVFFVSALLMWILIAQKMRWQLLIIHSCAMILNVLLNIWYIPRFGYIAAAWITGISEASICAVSFLFVLNKFRQERNSI